MPLTGNVAHDIDELSHHGKRKRSHREIVAIAVAEAKRRGTYRQARAGAPVRLAMSPDVIDLYRGITGSPMDRGRWQVLHDALLEADKPWAAHLARLVSQGEVHYLGGVLHHRWEASRLGYGPDDLAASGHVAGMPLHVEERPRGVAFFVGRPRLQAHPDGYYALGTLDPEEARGLLHEMEPDPGPSSDSRGRPIDSVANLARMRAGRPAPEQMGRPGQPVRLAQSDIRPLLAAVADSPRADAAPRLVLADALQEVGDPRHEVIRRHVARKYHEQLPHEYEPSPHIDWAGSHVIGTRDGYVTVHPLTGHPGAWVLAHFWKPERDPRSETGPGARWPSYGPEFSAEFNPDETHDLLRTLDRQGLLNEQTAHRADEVLAHPSLAAGRPAPEQLSRTGRPVRLSWNPSAMTDAELATLRQIEPRVRKPFLAWMKDLYNRPEDAADMQANLADERSRLSHVDDFLREQHQIDVRDDGALTFWKADRPTRRIIGDLPVVVWHHTSDALTERILSEGLRADVQTRANPTRNSAAGVYLTTERSGPAVAGYSHNAVAAHGGNPKTWGVRTTLAELSPDPDDEEISSGEHQFVLPHVPRESLFDPDAPPPQARMSEPAAPVRLGRLDTPPLFRSVVAAPHDSAPWLVLADSLDEEGKPATAEAIRVLGREGKWRTNRWGAEGVLTARPYDTGMGMAINRGTTAAQVSGIPVLLSKREGPWWHLGVQPHPGRSIIAEIHLDDAHGRRLLHEAQAHPYGTDEYSYARAAELARMKHWYPVLPEPTRMARPLIERLRVAVRRKPAPPFAEPVPADPRPNPALDAAMGVPPSEKAARVPHKPPADLFDTYVPGAQDLLRHPARDPAPLPPLAHPAPAAAKPKDGIPTLTPLALPHTPPVAPAAKPAPAPRRPLAAAMRELRTLRPKPLPVARPLPDLGSPAHPLDVRQHGGTWLPVAHRLAMRDRVRRAVRMAMGRPVRMSREVVADLHRALVGQPLDNARWGVLADALDEAGHPATAEAARLLHRTGKPFWQFDSAFNHLLATHPEAPHQGSRTTSGGVDAVAAGLPLRVYRELDSTGGWTVDFLSGNGLFDREIGEARLPDELGRRVLHETTSPDSLHAHLRHQYPLRMSVRGVRQPVRMNRLDFHRAIADAPKDDAPKLVYADWLADRGDPREHIVRAAVAFRHWPEPMGGQKYAHHGQVIWESPIGHPSGHGQPDYYALANTGSGGGGNIRVLWGTENPHDPHRYLWFEGDMPSHEAAAVLGQLLPDSARTIRQKLASFSYPVEAPPEPERFVRPADPYFKPGRWRRLGIVTRYDDAGTTASFEVRSHEPVADEFGRWSWGPGEVVRTGLSWDHVKADPELYRLYHDTGNLEHRPLARRELEHLFGEGLPEAEGAPGGSPSRRRLNRRLAVVRFTRPGVDEKPLPGEVAVATLAGVVHIGVLEDIDNGTAILRKRDGSAFATRADGLRLPYPGEVDGGHAHKFSAGDEPEGDVEEPREYAPGEYVSDRVGHFEPEAEPDLAEYIRNRMAADYGRSSAWDEMTRGTGYLLPDGTPVNMGDSITRYEDHRAAIPTHAAQVRWGWPKEVTDAYAVSDRQKALEELMRRARAVRVMIFDRDATFHSEAPLTRAQHEKVVGYVTRHRPDTVVVRHMDNEAEFDHPEPHEVEEFLRAPGRRRPGRMSMRQRPRQAVRLARRPVRLGASDDPGLLRRIAQDPRDDAGHLILADSLEEQGSPFGPLIRQYARGERNNNYWDWREQAANRIDHEDLHDPTENDLGVHIVGQHGPFHVFAQPSGMGGNPDAPLNLMLYPAVTAQRPQSFRYNVELSPHEAKALADQLGGEMARRLHEAARAQWFGGRRWYSDRDEQNPTYDQIIAQPPPERPEQMSMRGRVRRAVRLARRPVRLAGGPLDRPVVWHGSKFGYFGRFDPAMQGETDEGFYGRGFYFSPDRESAEEYGPARPFRLDIRRPFVVPSSGHMNHDSLYDLRDKVAALEGGPRELMTVRDIPPGYHLATDERENRYHDQRNPNSRPTGQVHYVAPNPELYGTEREVYGPEDTSPLGAVVRFNDQVRGIPTPSAGWASGLLKAMLERGRLHEVLQANGYDGIHVVDPDTGRAKEYVAFRPEQIEPVQLKRDGGPVRLSRSPDVAALHAGLAENPLDRGRWFVLADALQEAGKGWAAHAVRKIATGKAVGNVGLAHNWETKTWDGGSSGGHIGGLPVYLHGLSDGTFAFYVRNPDYMRDGRSMGWATLHPDVGIGLLHEMEPELPEHARPLNAYRAKYPTPPDPTLHGVHLRRGRPVRLTAGKPADCRCDYPSTTLRNGSGHGKTPEGRLCPVHVEYLKAKGRRQLGFDESGRPDGESPDRLSMRSLVHRAVRLDRDPAKPHKFACAMLTLTGKAADRIKELATAVPDADLADDGREDKPHVTCLFGLHPSDDLVEKVREVAREFGRPVKGRVTRLSAFRGADSGKDYDVLKFDVESEDLRELNRLLRELPHTQTHKEFHPHATVCYVKKGKAADYLPGEPLDAEFSIDAMVLADVDKTRHTIPLAQDAARLARPGGTLVRLPRSDLPGLIEAAHADPQDHAPKLILADALEEVGHSGAADVIRRATGHVKTERAMQNPFPTVLAPPVWLHKDGVAAFLSPHTSTWAGPAVRSFMGATRSRLLRQPEYRGLYVTLGDSIAPARYGPPTNFRTIAGHATHDAELIRRLLGEFGPPRYGDISSYRGLLRWLRPVIGGAGELAPGPYGRVPEPPPADNTPPTIRDLVRRGLRRLSAKAQGRRPVRFATPDDHRGMQAAIAARPDDDAPKLVYADMLDEDGHADLADVFRRATAANPRRWVNPPGVSGPQVTSVYGFHRAVPGAGVRISVHDSVRWRYAHVTPLVGLGTGELSLLHGYETHDMDHVRRLVDATAPAPNTGGEGSGYAHRQVRRVLGMPDGPERMSMQSRVRRAVRTIISPAEAIHAPAFKAWFGDWEREPHNASKVVGPDGRPLVVYHGTHSPKDFHAFEPEFPTDVYTLDGREVRRADSWDMGDDRQAAPDDYHYGALGDTLTFGDAAKALAFRQQEADHLASLMAEEGRTYVPSADTLRHLGDLRRLTGRRLERRTESRPSGDGSYFTPSLAYSYVRDIGGFDRGRVYPAYLNIRNPAYLNSAEIESAGRSWRMDDLKKEGHDGAIFAEDPKDLTKDGWLGSPQIVAFHPHQVKSATGNRGTFEPGNPDTRLSRRVRLARSPLHTDLHKRLLALRPELAQAAQKVYDEWDASDPEFGDAEVGFGGICQDIAGALGDILHRHGIDHTELDSQTGDQHVWVAAHDDHHLYHVDIPPGHYETGGGYDWQKIPGVRFGPDHVSIEPGYREDLDDAEHFRRRARPVRLRGRDLVRRAVRLAALRDRPVAPTGAADRLGTAGHKALVRALRDVLDRSGLTPNEVWPAVHDVGGQARASAVAAAYGERQPGAADYAAAWQGLVAKQPGLVVFRSHPDGPDSVYRLGFRGPTRAMSELLDRYGVASRVFVPRGHDTQVYVYDPGRKLRDSVGQLAGRLGLVAVEHTGEGRAIGGGDDLGRSAYRDTIRRAEAPGAETQQTQRMGRPGRPVRLMHEAIQFGDYLRTAEGDLREPKLKFADYVRDHGYGAVADAIVRANGSPVAGHDTAAFAGDMHVHGFAAGRLGPDELGYRRPLVEVYGYRNPAYSPAPPLCYRVEVRVPSTASANSEYLRHVPVARFETTDHDLVRRLLDDIGPGSGGPEDRHRPGLEAIVREGLEGAGGPPPQRMAMRDRVRRAVRMAMSDPENVPAHDEWLEDHSFPQHHRAVMATVDYFRRHYSGGHPMTSREETRRAQEDDYGASGYTGLWNARGFDDTETNPGGEPHPDDDFADLYNRVSRHHNALYDDPEGYEPGILAEDLRRQAADSSASNPLWPYHPALYRLGEYPGPLAALGVAHIAQQAEGHPQDRLWDVSAGDTASEMGKRLAYNHGFHLPAHPEAKQLLDRAVQDPHDAAPWLVYADWLDEHDYPVTAAHVREAVPRQQRLSMRSRIRRAVRLARPDAPAEARALTDPHPAAREAMALALHARHGLPTLAGLLGRPGEPGPGPDDLRTLAATTVHGGPELPLRVSLLAHLGGRYRLTVHGPEGFLGHRWVDRPEARRVWEEFRPHVRSAAWEAAAGDMNRLAAEVDHQNLLKLLGADDATPGVRAVLPAGVAGLPARPKAVTVGDLPARDPLGTRGHPLAARPGTLPAGVAAAGTTDPGAGVTPQDEVPTNPQLVRPMRTWLAMRDRVRQPVRNMRDAAAFGDMIAASPGDHAPALVFADYLEENGYPAAAEVVRRGNGRPTEHEGDIDYHGNHFPTRGLASGTLGSADSPLEARPHVHLYAYGGSAQYKGGPARPHYNVYVDAPRTGAYGKATAGVIGTSDHDLVRRILQELGPPQTEAERQDRAGVERQVAEGLARQAAEAQRGAQTRMARPVGRERIRLTFRRLRGESGVLAHRKPPVTFSQPARDLRSAAMDLWRVLDTPAESAAQLQPEIEATLRRHGDPRADLVPGSRIDFATGPPAWAKAGRRLPDGSLVHLTVEPTRRDNPISGRVLHWHFPPSQNAGARGFTLSRPVTPEEMWRTVDALAPTAPDVGHLPPRTDRLRRHLPAHDIGAFERAVAEAPHDQAPRLVFADWLDEHDQPELAHVARLDARSRLGDGARVVPPVPYLDHLAGMAWVLRRYGGRPADQAGDDMRYWHSAWNGVPYTGHRSVSPGQRRMWEEQLGAMSREAPTLAGSVFETTLNAGRNIAIDEYRRLQGLAQVEHPE
jgi:uncharacterized protein (TIGR02996 family)